MFVRATGRDLRVPMYFRAEIRPRLRRSSTEALHGSSVRDEQVYAQNYLGETSFYGWFILW